MAASVAKQFGQGSRAYLGIGTTWMQLLLGPGSLVNTYRSPSIAAVLTATGRLDSATAGRRIQETGLWLGSAVLPDALMAGAPGYVATAQVRLLHAGVRRQLLKGGWDVDRWGVPINQVDLARTLLDFTYVPIEAMRRLGVGFTADERDDVYHLFRHIGHLVGLDPILHFDNHQQATGWSSYWRRSAVRRTRRRGRWSRPCSRRTTNCSARSCTPRRR